MRNLLYILIVINVFCISGCNNTISQNETSTTISQNGTITDKQIIESFTVDSEVNYQEEISVLKGYLPTCNKDLLTTVPLSIESDYWYIDNQKYTLEKSTYSPIYPHGYWEFDLSKFEPAGICNGTMLFFAPSGKINSEILVATDENTTYLLVLNDYLNPVNYNYSDFICEQQSNITESLLNKIWNVHKYTNHDVAVTDTPPTGIKMKLKNNPAITYNLWYVECDGVYYTNRPYQSSKG